MGQGLWIENAVVFQDLMVEVDTIFAQIFALDAFRHHVVELFSRQEEVAECAVDIVVIRVLQGLARELHVQIFHERPKCFGRESCWGKVDVKAQRERAWYDDLVRIQLGHEDIQLLAGVRFRRVESDAIDDAFCLHGAPCLFCLSEVLRHLPSHPFKLFFELRHCILQVEINF